MSRPCCPNCGYQGRVIHVYEVTRIGGGLGRGIIFPSREAAIDSLRRNNLMCDSIIIERDVDMTTCKTIEERQV